MQIMLLNKKSGDVTTRITLTLPTIKIFSKQRTDFGEYTRNIVDFPTALWLDSTRHILDLGFCILGFGMTFYFQEDEWMLNK